MNDLHFREKYQDKQGYKAPVVYLTGKEKRRKRRELSRK